MRLLAAGRASEVYDLGNGTVLRRFKTGGDAAREALAMQHVRAHGFPVPRVLEVRPEELVLERIGGPTMLSHLRLRPWRLPAYALRLAALHKRLHEIEAPAGLPAVDDGTALLHLDFHPLNVILARGGPVVIDWTNARRGTPALDVATTCVILATNGGRAGRAFGAAYLRAFDRAAVAAALPRAIDLRLADPNVTEDERRALRALVPE